MYGGKERVEMEFGICILILVWLLGQRERRKKRIGWNWGFWKPFILYMYIYIHGFCFVVYDDFGVSPLWDPRDRRVV